MHIGSTAGWWGGLGSENAVRGGSCEGTLSLDPRRYLDATRGNRGGAPGARVTHTRCRFRGAPLCESMVRW